MLVSWSSCAVLRLIDDVWNEFVTCSGSSISFIEFVWMIRDGIGWSISRITIILRRLRSAIKESIAIQLLFLQRTPILILLLHIQPQRLHPILINISSIRIPMIGSTRVNILIIRPICNIKWTSPLSLIEPVMQRMISKTRYQSLIKHNTF